MKNLFVIISLLFACFIHQTTKAQAGDSCNNPIRIYGAGCLNDSMPPNSDRWYAFTAMSTSVSINIQVDSNSPGHVHTITLYPNCSSPFISQTSVLSIGQDTLVLRDTGLTIGNTYYIKLSDNIGGCLRCDSGRAVYIICIVNGTGGTSGNDLSHHIVLNGMCGLNFVHADTMTQIRSKHASPPFNTNGTSFPAYLKISGLPTSCDTILHAYLYWIESYFTGYNGVDTFDVTNPAGKTFVNQNAFFMGNGQQKGWNEAGTAAYVADIRKTISGNGLYKINIVPPFDGNAPDTEIDGLTLLIIYQDLSASYQGNIALNQGIMTSNGGGSLTHGVSSFDPSTVCDSSSNATFFAIVSDAQANCNGGVHVDNMNGAGGTFNNNFWNWDQINTGLSSTVTTIPYNIYTNNTTTSHDDYSSCLMGVYWQCGSCTPYKLTVTAVPDTICKGQSSVLTASGGATSYKWSTGATTSSITVTPATTTTYYVTANAGSGCPQKDSITVYVNPAAVLVSLAPRTICQGQCVTLSEPVVFGQSDTWKPSTGLSCTTCFTTIACPTVTTTYTVVARTLRGCSDSTTVTITVVPAPIANAGPNDTICVGNCAPIGAGSPQPGVTYSWTPTTGVACSTCLNTTACPTVTTTYTLVAKDSVSGMPCSDTSKVTIVVVPIPPPPSISGFTVACDSNAIYTVTNVAIGATYTWTAKGGIPTSGIGTSAHINFYPNGGTVYWKADNGHGCFSIDSLVVTPCCVDTAKGVINIFNNTSAVIFPGKSIINPVVSKKIFINGTFTVNKSIAFVGCDINMGPNAKIIVNTKDTMELNANICNHIHAGCNYMWSGIHIQAGGWFISDTNGGNLIEDADTAIEAMNTLTKQAFFQIRSTYLNKNYYGIVIEPFNGVYKGFIRASVITCRDFSTLFHPNPFPQCFFAGATYWKTFPFDSLIAPRITVRSFVGVYISNTGGFKENGVNVYDNLDNGIASFHTNLIVQRDTFEHINSSNISYGAVVAAGGAPATSLAVGNGAGLGNTFTDCTNGVFGVFGSFSTLAVRLNTFNFNVPATNLPTDTRAIWLRNSGIGGTTTANLSNNSINNAYIGIECDINSNINANIANNTISGSPFCSGTPMMSGIVINELLSATAIYHVHHNTIGNLQFGILANSVFNADIYSNNITLIRGFGLGCPIVFGSGIQLSNGNNCQITTNTISTSFFGTSQQFTGIYVSTSPLTVVCSNHVTGMWNGINFSGAMGLGCTCVSNVLNWGSQTNAKGILVTFGAIIGPQGALGNPSQNTWNAGYPCRSEITALAGLSPFFISAGPTFAVAPGCPPFVTTITTGTAAACLPPTPTSAPLFRQVANTQIAFPTYTDTSVNMSKQGLTHILWRNKSLLVDTTLKHFNDSIQKVSMGMLLAADTLMNDTTGLLLPGLLTTVNSISPVSNIESNLQSVSSTYLQSAVSQQYILTSSQLNNLRILANKCPFQDGAGVYEARALLVAYDGLTPYSDSCLSTRSDTNARMRMKEKTSGNFYNEDIINIYPNPNNGSFTIDYQLSSNETGKVVLYNTTGQVMGEYLLNSSQGRMHVTSLALSNGVYVYKLCTSQNTTKVGRLVIIK